MQTFRQRIQSVWRNDLERQQTQVESEAKQAGRDEIVQELTANLAGQAQEACRAIGQPERSSKTDPLRFWMPVIRAGLKAITKIANAIHQMDNNASIKVEALPEVLHAEGIREGVYRAAEGSAYDSVPHRAQPDIDYSMEFASSATENVLFPQGTLGPSEELHDLAAIPSEKAAGKIDVQSLRTDCGAQKVIAKSSSDFNAAEREQLEVGVKALREEQSHELAGERQRRLAPVGPTESERREHQSCTYSNNSRSDLRTDLVFPSRRAASEYVAQRWESTGGVGRGDRDYLVGVQIDPATRMIFRAGVYGGLRYQGTQRQASALVQTGSGVVDGDNGPG